MSTYNLTTLEISTAVARSLREKKWTVTECCNYYNSRSKRPNRLQKDFVHRVKKNNFSVISQRVVDLCDFLEIESNEKSFNYRLQKEIEAVERVVQRNPMIESKIKDLLKNIVEIAGA